MDRPYFVSPCGVALGNHEGLTLRGHSQLDPSTRLRVSGPSPGFTPRRTFGPRWGTDMTFKG